MAGSINNFKSSFTKDLARPSRFDVNIPIPLTLLPYVQSSRRLNYRCENANLPGRTFATTEQKTYGPIEKYPYLTTYNDISLTFIIDDDILDGIYVGSHKKKMTRIYKKTNKTELEQARDVFSNLSLFLPFVDLNNIRV